MDVTKLLNQDCMILDLKATNKADAIDEMVQRLYEAGVIQDVASFKEGILKREAQSSTGLGDGIAIPHAKCASVKQATVLFARSKQGLDYEALDGQNTHLFFMIAAPEGANNEHLQALSALSQLLMNPSFVGKLKEVTSKEQVIELFKEEQKEEEKQNQPVVEENNDAPFIVAVTACPTGIAHTYMAEKALYQAAKDLNVNIKVETNGSDGAKNVLTSDEIAKAQAVIIAADKKVETARFAGKRVLFRPVADGVRKPEVLIDEALSDRCPIYEADQAVATEEKAQPTSVWQTIYKHLMNGVSTMLPFIIGGGIMIALAFLIDQTMGVPKDHLAQLGSYHPAAAMFKQIGDAAFGFMLPVLAGFIASSIADRPGLVAGFVAGALANAGGAGFLGALVGGFAAGYLVLGVKKVFSYLPNALAGIRSVLLYPLFGVMVTGFAMLLINIPMKAINDALNGFLNGMSGTSAVLLGALLAGMMAVDLGGPVNKAAYVFATGTLAASVASGGSVMMAATMAGGMVPPLAIFVATTLFRNKFTKEERDAGLSNIVMGLSFVTEGAIPFAAADPLRAIPSFIIGSAVTGGLVGLMNIKLMAPHGGIFVIMLVSHPFLYLGLIALGAVISGVILGLLKKKQNA